MERAKHESLALQEISRAGGGPIFRSAVIASCAAIDGLKELYRDEIYSLQNLLSRTQARPGRPPKKEQEEISLNHIQRLNLISVVIVLYVCHIYI